jgi:hypothetical protein
MNTTDAFAQLLFGPYRRLFVRVDYHWLALTHPRDLWYGGSGATNDDVFGFTGVASGGRDRLAQLVDLSVTVEVRKQLVVGAYYGHAFGAGAVRSTFDGADADYAFVETTLSF